jgi:adenylate kinase family enzyme
VKIMIIGSGGSGKSTFASQLGTVLKLPVYHLDAYYWHPGWVPTPDNEWDEFQNRLITNDQWIIDGNYGRTLEIRMNAADVIIYFDLSPLICTYRVIKRRIKYHGRTRPDLNEQCPEQLDWAFIKWVWNFRKTRRQSIMEKIQIYKDGKRILIINRTKQVKDILKQITTEGTSYFEEDENFL